MSQTDRDRLVALKKAKDKKMTQRQAAEELNISERQVRRLLAKPRKGGDKAILHGLRGRSNRKIRDQAKQQAIQMLSGGLSSVRVETRRAGEIAVRFEGQYVRIVERQPASKTAAKVATSATGKAAAPAGKSKWMNGFWERPAPSLNKAIRISNATS